MVAAAAVLIAGSDQTSPAGADHGPSAWQALVQENPGLAEDANLGPLERAVLETLTPEQHAAFVDGTDPASLVLASGETLADFLERLATKGAVTEGLVYYPLPRCTVLETWSATLGKMAAGETRDFIVRGEATDLSDQGGSATGCGVPAAAEALMANFRISDHDSGTGQLRVYASDQSAGYPLINYQADTGLISTNASALDLCLAAACASDFRVWTKSAEAHVRMDVLGYFAPLGTGGLSTSGTTTTTDLTITGLDCSGNSNGGALTTDVNGVVSCSDDDDSVQDLFATVDAPGGTDPVADAATDTLTLAEGGIVTITGDAATDTVTISATEVDGSISNELQNLFATITGDAGSTTADAQADSLSVVGSGMVSTAVAGDTLTITGAGDGLGGHTATQNLDLSTFKLVGNGGSDGLSVAADGTVTFDGPVTAGAGVSQAPATPVLVGSVTIGANPSQVYVSGRYAYVTDDAGASDGLRILDVADPTQPREVGVIELNSVTDGVYVAGRYAYVGARGAGPNNFTIVDVSDPASPSVAGTGGTLGSASSVSVSGRYAYVADGSVLRVFDVADPRNPSVVTSTAIGSVTSGLTVAGTYAYTTDGVGDSFRIVDITDPASPVEVGSLNFPSAFPAPAVSGSYAYVINGIDLIVIDVSDPTSPSQAGIVALSSAGGRVFAGGRYVYALGDTALSVIDVTDPTTPTVVASVALTDASGLFVAGGYAYVLESGALDELRIYDLSATEVPTLTAHSLEAGQLQVRNDVIAQGHLAVTGGVNIGSGGLFSDGNVGISGTVAIANDVAPTSSPANLVQLYAEDAAGSSELKVRDEAGNVTTLSPHNFSLTDGPSEPLAWSFYSENDHGRINVDMLRTVRLVEQMSGEKLVHTQTTAAVDIAEGSELPIGLEARIDALTRENRELKSELARIKELLGIKP